MKILVITNDFPPTLGGIENYIFSLVRRWDPSKVKVITRWVPGADEFDRDLGFEVIREPVGTLLPTPALFRKAKNIVEQESIDVVHFASTLPLGILGVRLLKACGVPFATTVHGGEFRLASKLPIGRTLLRKILRDVSVVMAQSTFSADIVRDFADPCPPIQMATCGVDAERFGKQAVTPIDAPGHPLLISVSRLVARKGPHTLISAMPAILAKHPQAHAMIVGGGPDTGRLMKLARTLRIQDRVHFTGPQQWQDVPRYYAAADIFVLPTRERFGGIETEGLPLVYVEAAASGLPLIGGRAGGVADAVRDGETGFLVDGREPAMTADAVDRILSDPSLAEILGKNARAMAETDFDWDKIFKDFEAALITHAVRT